MSVLVWDGYTLAADQQINDGGLAVPGRKVDKLHTANVEALVGYVGTTEVGLALMDWYAKGANPEDWPKNKYNWGEDSARLVVVERRGPFPVLVFEYERAPIKQRVFAPHMAWGSGAGIAMGALAMGASSVVAVELAIKLHVECGLGVDAIKF